MRRGELNSANEAAVATFGHHTIQPNQFIRAWQLDEEMSTLA